MNLYKGPVFFVDSNSTFELLASYSTKVEYTGFQEFSIGLMEDIGLKLIKINNQDLDKSEFLIPVGSKFKLKFDRRYDYTTRKYIRIPILLFTTTLNKSGVVKGGFAIVSPKIALEVQQLS
jgi:hypothetical protein